MPDLTNKLFNPLKQWTASITKLDLCKFLSINILSYPSNDNNVCFICSIANCIYFLGLESNVFNLASAALTAFCNLNLVASFQSLSSTSCVSLYFNSSF